MSPRTVTTIVPMKHLQRIALLAVFYLLLSCKAKETVIAPAGSGLSGTWLLFESRLWNGSNWATTSIAASPQQTLTFTDPHELLAKAIQDAALAQSHYFDVIAGDLTGPALAFKKDKDSPVIGFFTYSLARDTLRITTPSVTLISYGYSFRRL